ncbi:hypothetical protein ABPG77_005572 [Micractinium sp. CCAP 211/92]
MTWHPRLQPVLPVILSSSSSNISTIVIAFIAVGGVLWEGAAIAQRVGQLKVSLDETAKRLEQIQEAAERRQSEAERRHREALQQADLGWQRQQQEADRLWARTLAKLNDRQTARTTMQPAGDDG